MELAALTIGLNSLPALFVAAACAPYGCPPGPCGVGVEGDTKEELIAKCVALNPPSSFTVRMRRVRVPREVVADKVPDLAILGELPPLSALEFVRSLELEAVYWRLSSLVDTDEPVGAYALDQVWDVRQRPSSEYIQQTSAPGVPVSGIYGSPAYGLHVDLTNRQLSLVSHADTLTVWSLGRVLRPLPTGERGEVVLRAASWEVWHGVAGGSGFRITDAEGEWSTIVVVDPDSGLPVEAFRVSPNDKLSVTSTFAYEGGAADGALVASSMVFFSEASIILYDIANVNLEPPGDDDFRLLIPHGLRLFDFRAAATGDLGVDETRWPHEVRSRIKVAPPSPDGHAPAHSHGAQVEPLTPVQLTLRVVGVAVVAVGVLGLIVGRRGS